MIGTLALLAACGPSLPAGGERPDIVLISVDTLRADHLGAYGYTAQATSPFLDSLAARGVRFANARAPSPWTLPSHTTMLSGLLPHEHLVVDDEVRINPATPMLQERLRAEGYATLGVVSTLYVSRKFGFDRGFDTFDDFGLKTEKQNLSGSVDAKDVFDRGLEALAELEDGQPAFLFLHVYDAHYSYDAPFPWNLRFDRLPRRGDARYKKYFYFFDNPLEADQLVHQIAQYDEEIRYIDHQIERLAGAFAEAGREAIFVITSDHGEEFFERGSWGHAHTLYPEQLHVPLIIAGPGLPEGVVVEGGVGTQDIAPTIAALAGVEGLGSGISLAPYLSGVTPPVRPLICDTSRFSTNRIGLYEDGLRLDWDLKNKKVALYADPLEEYDVASDRPDDVARLKQALTEQLGAPWQLQQGRLRTEGVALSEGARERPIVRADQEPLSFAVVPVDADVYVHGRGPWRAAGGALPGSDDPIVYIGPGAESVELSAADRARLRALGYVQEDEE